MSSHSQGRGIHERDENGRSIHDVVEVRPSTEDAGNNRLLRDWDVLVGQEYLVTYGCRANFAPANKFGGVNAVAAGSERHKLGSSGLFGNVLRSPS